MGGKREGGKHDLVPALICFQLWLFTSQIKFSFPKSMIIHQSNPGHLLLVICTIHCLKTNKLVVLKGCPTSYKSKPDQGWTDSVIVWFCLAIYIVLLERAESPYRSTAITSRNTSCQTCRQHKDIGINSIRHPLTIDRSSGKAMRQKM